MIYPRRRKHYLDHEFQLRQQYKVARVADQQQQHIDKDDAVE